LKKLGTTNAMDWASENGHLCVDQFLHSIGKNLHHQCHGLGFLKTVICVVVQFLHKHWKNLHHNAMNWASGNGHLCVVQILE